MSNRHQQRLAKFDAILDTLLVSEHARLKALHGDIPILVTAAKMIGLEHPQLSEMSKQALRDRILTHHYDIQTKPLFDESKTAETLFNAPHPTLNDDTRKDILSQVLATTTQSAQPELSRKAKTAMFDSVRQAQQARQLDKMLISKEALAIAKRNPDPLIQAAVTLVSTPAPALSQTARASIKQQIIPETVTSKPILRPVFAQWKQVAASVAVFIFISLFALPVASQDALPGDVLYPVKRTVERARLVVTASDNGRAQLYLNFASERINEASQLMERGVYNARLVDTALLNLDASSVFSMNDALQAEIDVVEASFDMLITELQSAELLDDATAQSYRSPDDVVIIETTPEPSATIEPAPEIEETASETPEVTEIAPVDIVTTTEDPVMTTTSATIFYVNTNARVNVRSQPTTSSAIIAQISGADTVTQIGTNSDSTWYQVALATGEQGWIASTLLTTNADDAEQVRNSQAQSANSNGTNNANSGQANGADNANPNGADNASNGADNANPNGADNASNGADNGNASGNNGGNRRGGNQP